MLQHTLAAGDVLAQPLHAGVDPLGLFFMIGAVLMFAVFGWLALATDRPVVPPTDDVTGDTLARPLRTAASSGVKRSP
jgi:hypothetical protein